MNTQEFGDKAEALLAAYQLDELEAAINEELCAQMPEPVTPNDPARMWLEYYQARLHWRGRGGTRLRTAFEAVGPGPAGRLARPGVALVG